MTQFHHQDRVSLGQCCFNSRIEVVHFRGLRPCFVIHFFRFSLFAVHSGINSIGYAIRTEEDGNATYKVLSSGYI
jgi:hypothetical protein